MHSFFVILESARVEDSLEACLVAKIVVDTFARLRIASKGGGMISWQNASQPSPGQIVRRLGVHGFGTEQPEVLVPMDLELSNQKSWCP